MQGGLTRSQEGVKLSKMDIKDVVTFHSGEQEELDAPIETWREIRIYLEE
jgi:hypothetical protein